MSQALKEGTFVPSDDGIYETYTLTLIFWWVGGIREEAIG